MKTVKDLNIKNKKVIIRCDFNVVIKDGKVLDDTRITSALETIRYCLDNNCKVILLSHLGRVKEKADLIKNNLYPVSIILKKYLNTNVYFSEETRGKGLENIINNMKEKEVVLIQNTRYEDLDSKKESSNDQELATYWASLADIFINDAFGTIHRAHASNVGIANILPSAVGFLIEKELKELSILKNPPHPFILILGGSKVEDKIGVIKVLVEKADKILIGGAMAFTFLKAMNYEIGKSLLDIDNIDFCKDILKKYKEKIVLPIDIITSKKMPNEEGYKKEEIKLLDIENISFDEIGLDIGSKTLELFKENIINSSIVFWNGPLGLYEYDEFKVNTEKLLKYIVENNIKTIIGGGDIVTAATKYKDKLYHVSTGGGATLEYLEGKSLPGLSVIKGVDNEENRNI